MSKSYQYKGFVITRGLCESHQNMWTIMDWRDYNELVGATLVSCVTSIGKAKEEVNNLLFVENNVPF